MSTVVAFPSNAIFGQQAALAFYESDRLSRFETTFVFNEHDLLGKVVGALPTAIKAEIEPQLRRRELVGLPRDIVKTTSTWEVIRTIASLLRVSPKLIDHIWDKLSLDFTYKAAARLTDKDTAIYAYEYTALEAFKIAGERGIRKILDFPSLNSREFEQQQDDEKERFPELLGPHEKHFKALFEGRQARRDEEMSLADLIVTNSSITRASHIAFGAPPERTVVVPYGAPPTVASILDRNYSGQLKVVWAGTFSIRKGAHYLVEALRRMRADKSIQVEVYGAISVPQRVWQPCPPSLRFMGSVPRQTLFAAFDAADVLVFPTLSDGFGMVVTEAFARGLPVITTRRAGASDLVRSGVNGLIISAGTPDAIVEAFDWCLHNRDALDEMRPAALQSARDWQWRDYRKALRLAVDCLPFETPSTQNILK
jgi:glycosyltransferase involved in cell wall biosynthesis